MTSLAPLNFLFAALIAATSWLAVRLAALAFGAALLGCAMLGMWLVLEPIVLFFIHPIGA